MIGTEFIKGQGLGNQLFCYVTARAIAEEKGYEFGCAGQDRLAVNIHSNKGMYFMDMDLGHVITEEEKQYFKRYDEAEERLYLGNSVHDMEHGCYVAGADQAMHDLEDNTLIYGNMQDESYFIRYKDKLKDWLKVKAEYEDYEYSRENLCIINMRGGEYTSSPELYLNKKYWLHAMKEMKRIRPDMEFMVVTEDVKAAEKLLPGIPAYHFDIAKDYVTIKNAVYLIVSNSSFACLPAHTSETIKFVIAPKYWARHNFSNGYWASEQNIYSLFHYMDRKGRLFTAQECRKELDLYKKEKKEYKRLNQPPKGLIVYWWKIKSGWIAKKHRLLMLFYGVKRKIRMALSKG